MGSSDDPLEILTLVLLKKFKSTMEEKEWELDPNTCCWLLVQIAGKRLRVSRAAALTNWTTGYSRPGLPW